MKWGILGLIIVVICAQAYRFSGIFKPSEIQPTQTILSSDPCQEFQLYPADQGTRMPILLSNCWSKLRYPGHYPKEVLFPHDFGRRFRNFQKVYDIAINNRKSQKLDSQDQAILSTILSGDEMRRIQGLYFLCAHSSIISQVNWANKTAEDQFNYSFLQACQQNFAQKSGLKHYLGLSAEEQESQFQQHFSP